MIAKRSRRLGTVTAGLALSLTLALTGPASAQTPPDTIATEPPESIVETPARAGLTSHSVASMLRGGPMGELLSVYQPRDPNQVRRLLDNARSVQRSTDEEIDDSRRIADAADGRVRIMEEEIRTSKTRRDVAKKMKNDADRANFDQVVRRQEAEKRYLERLRDALRADAARLESERSAAAARVKALELESDVASRQAQLGAIAAPSPDDIADYRKRLKQMLEAQKTASVRGKEAADRRGQVAKRRLKQLDALGKLAK